MTITVYRTTAIKGDSLVRFDGLVAASIGRWRVVCNGDDGCSCLYSTAIGCRDGCCITSCHAVAVADGRANATVAIAQVPTVDDITTSGDRGGQRGGLAEGGGTVVNGR